MLRQFTYMTQKPAYLEELQYIQECLWSGFERPVESVYDVGHNLERRLQAVVSSIQPRNTRTVKRMLEEFEACSREARAEYHPDAGNMFVRHLQDVVTEYELWYARPRSQDRRKARS